MEPIHLKLNPDHYPLILRQYGLEGAKIQAINMVSAQKLEMTEENLYSCLSTLEMSLEEMFG
ncbi:hypothetical protein AGMMS50255_6860 [Spirochaetia bacterium]|nr:hypothetical protein AGMMS50255_6860 [Spirochaetia bacterium]